MERKWLFISLVDEEKFLGGIFSQQNDPDKSPLLPANWTVNLPNGWQLLIIEAPNAPEDHQYHARLLDKDELEECGFAPSRLGDHV